MKIFYVIHIINFFKFSLVNKEVENMKKEQKEIQANLQSFINSSKKDVEAVKTGSKADLEALKKTTKADIDSAVSKNQPKQQDLSQYTTSSQLKTRFIINF